MFRNLTRNTILKGAAAIAAVYVVAALIFSADTLVEIMNGLYLGVLVSVVAVYWRTGWDALKGEGEYGRVQHFAIGCTLLWISFTIIRSVSILTIAWPEWGWLRSSHFISIAQVLAVLAGFMQVTAPDFKSGYARGRDHDTLIGAMLLSVIVSVGAYIFQNWRH